MEYQWLLQCQTAVRHLANPDNGITAGLYRYRSIAQMKILNEFHNANSKPQHRSYHFVIISPKFPMAPLHT